MRLTPLWIKGLSSQGKIYLATSSLIGGATVTGTLAVDDTRSSIWRGTSYVTDQVGSTFSSLFNNSEKAQGREDDSSITGAITNSLDFLGELIFKIAGWSWSASIKSIHWLKDSKDHYSKYSSHLTRGWEHLQKHWKTLWEFIKRSLDSLELDKFYELLTSPNKRDKAIELFGEKHRQTMKIWLQTLPV
ncbi:hypothetical protein MHLP_03815 [Candidatus Mycoplasma haematolamae str. Purdue]|uniref:Uncharacterized protein n=1 Tax=Mycoplasma haematolamae (strain Purdue) TaxID=1212765 RepID=I7BKD2_MYCHA|nr:hypothetical protein [Candidatus Mycoplasma haematolamae]AFO52343.1 hypothetical protein MHLP_03815 [Candidatus Mycoplasma haematolamae str. Purdue]